MYLYSLSILDLHTHMVVRIMPNTCVWSQKDILTGQQLITTLIGQRYETSTYPCRYYELVSSVFSLTNDVLGTPLIPCP